MITKQKADQVQAAIAAALDLIGKSHGLEIKAGVLTFREVDFTMSISGRESALFMDERPEWKDWARYTHRHGMPLGWLGRTVMQNGVKYQVTGYLKNCSTNVVELNGGAQKASVRWLNERIAEDDARQHAAERRLGV